VDHPFRRRAGAGLGAALLSASVLGLTGLAPATAAPGDPLATGPDWTVERAAGGYLVTVDLDAPLPIKSDAPTVVVDGEAVGIATEAADSRSLSVFTTDASVTDASRVEPGWASEAETGTAAGKAAAPVEVPDDVQARALPADPTALGSYDWDEAIYTFGDQAIPLAGIGGIRGEMEGKVYLPTTGGARPTVVLLHGRHTSCYGPGTANPNRWPCATSPEKTDRLSIPSYAGYDGTARALASQGYSVVSISANAINSNDNQLAADQGARARGQLILDTLTMLDRATKGEQVSYDDAWTGRTVDLDQAFTDGAASYALRSDGFVGGAPPLDPMTAADLVGQFDLSTIGLMGHSRGGEGVTSATVLNEGLAQPWAIESILPLAPVDFGRMSVPDVPMNVMLPYCDGDVSNQQGQHFLDDSRYGFGDDVLRSGVWAMGANHNFYNTVWTPGEYAYSVSDDWSGAEGSTSPTSIARRTDPVCGTDPSVAATSIRMTADEQYRQGTAYMTGWFRLTLGGEEQFLPMFDGSGEVPDVLGDEDVRSVSTAPEGDRTTITSFEGSSSQVRPAGTATVNPCASLSGRTTPQSLPACASTLGSAQVPHWTPASNAGNVPATPMSRMSWTSETGEIRVSVPRASRDASTFDRLSVKMAADETVPTGTDLTMTVLDGSGGRWSAPVSQLNPLALVRFPTSASTAAATTLKKVVLQQVDVPVATLRDAGLAVGDLREVRFTAAVGADGTTSGAAYLSDLAFERSSVGDPTVGTRPVVQVFAPNRAEGDAPDTGEVAAYLGAPASTPVTGFVSVLGSSTSRAGATMEPVTFAAGETCVPVPYAVQGDTAASTTNGSVLKASVVDTAGGVMGGDAIVFTTLSEDDGITPPATGTAPTPLPAYGTPGDVCAELDSVQTGGTVTSSPVAPGGTATLVAEGFRAGEDVTFTVEGLDPVVATADEAGTATASVPVPAEEARGSRDVTAVGAGTGRTATGTLAVRGASSPQLSLSSPQVEYGDPATATVTVPGATDGEVEISVEDYSDTIPVDETGQAETTLPRLLEAGSYTVEASYLGTEETDPSGPVTADYRVTPRSTTTTTTAPSRATRGSVFSVRVRVGDLVSGGSDPGTVRLRTTGGGQDRSRSKAVPGDGVVTFSVRAPTGGQRLQLVARFVPGSGDYAGSTAPLKAVRLTR